MGRHCANCDAISSITCSIQRKAAAAGKAQIDGHILNSIFMQSYSSLHFSKEFLWAIRECACQRVLCHISAICFKPTHPLQKKKNRQNKTYKLKVVLKGASKPILPDDTHNEPKMSFSFFSSATHTTAAAAVQCWGLSSLNRNVFSQLSIQKYFLFSGQRDEVIPPPHFIFIFSPEP